jgi:hypothetical protein
MENTYNILQYKHKKILIKDLTNFNDVDFKKQIILNYRGDFFSAYTLKYFYLHIRNINLCINKLSKKQKDSTERLLKNSIIYLYENYLDSFINSILSYYFQITAKDYNKQLILNKIVYSVLDEYYEKHK